MRCIFSIMHNCVECKWFCCCFFVPLRIHFFLLWSMWVWIATAEPHISIIIIHGKNTNLKSNRWWQRRRQRTIHNLHGNTYLHAPHHAWICYAVNYSSFFLSLCVLQHACSCETITPHANYMAYCSKFMWHRLHACAQCTYVPLMPLSLAPNDFSIQFPFFIIILFFILGFSAPKPTTDYIHASVVLRVSCFAKSATR